MANPVSPQQLNAALTTLLDQAIEAEARGKLRQLQPTDWTVQRVMEEHKLSDGLARKVLRKMVADGLAFEINVRSEKGRTCKGWRPTEKGRQNG
jgi:predicted ArsR family transcriptional regulator